MTYENYRFQPRTAQDNIHQQARNSAYRIKYHAIETNVQKPRKVQILYENPLAIALFD